MGRDTRSAGRPSGPSTSARWVLWSDLGLVWGVYPRLVRRFISEIACACHVSASRCAGTVTLCGFVA
ncbi:hypothetical protein BIFBIF_00811 [Bifidobacterium bifidum ATCC 29521 = JCM 1255 = DSM 20456]|nr:hypothetical protein BIFBIF_00811 [Bifidobacterium bifidum ATCC 29521 = JCM 1255 = DSM 20456]